MDDTYIEEKIPQDLESKKAFWKQHFRNWKSSGVTIAEYCRQAGLPKSSFGYWRTKLRRINTPAGFVEVKLKDSAVGSQIRITLPNRIEISAPSGTDARYLSDLVGSISQQ